MAEQHLDSQSKITNNRRAWAFGWVKLKQPPREAGEATQELDLRVFGLLVVEQDLPAAQGKPAEVSHG